MTKWEGENLGPMMARTTATKKIKKGKKRIKRKPYQKKDTIFDGVLRLLMLLRDSVTCLERAYAVAG